MFFQVTNLDENNVQENIIKVRANLRNGVTEFLEGHIDMIGRIDNDIVLTQSVVENRTIIKEFIVQNGIVVVSNGGLNPTAPNNATGPKRTYVLVHSKEIVELTGTLDDKKVDELTKKLDKKTIELEKELTKLNLSLVDLSDIENKRLIFKGKSGVKIRNAFEDSEFLKKALTIIKDRRKS